MPSKTGQEKTRTISFMAHSLGGIFFKRALQDSQGNAEVKLLNVESSTASINFLGTPQPSATS